MSTQFDKILKGFFNDMSKKRSGKAKKAKTPPSTPLTPPPPLTPVQKKKFFEYMAFGGGILKAKYQDSGNVQYLKYNGALYLNVLSKVNDWILILCDDDSQIQQALRDYGEPNKLILVMKRSEIESVRDAVFGYYRNLRYDQVPPNGVVAYRVKNVSQVRNATRLQKKVTTLRPVEPPVRPVEPPVRPTPPPARPPVDPTDPRPPIVRTPPPPMLPPSSPVQVDKNEEKLLAKVLIDKKFRVEVVKIGRFRGKEKIKGWLEDVGAIVSDILTKSNQNTKNKIMRIINFAEQLIEYIYGGKEPNGGGGRLQMLKSSADQLRPQLEKNGKLTNLGKIAQVILNSIVMKAISDMTPILFRLQMRRQLNGYRNSLRSKKPSDVHEVIAKVREDIFIEIESIDAIMRTFARKVVGLDDRKRNLDSLKLHLAKIALAIRLFKAFEINPKNLRTLDEMLEKNKNRIKLLMLLGEKRINEKDLSTIFDVHGITGDKRNKLLSIFRELSKPRPVPVLVDLGGPPPSPKPVTYVGGALSVLKISEDEFNKIKNNSSLSDEQKAKAFARLVANSEGFKDKLNNISSLENEISTIKSDSKVENFVKEAMSFFESLLNIVTREKAYQLITNGNERTSQRQRLNDSYGKLGQMKGYDAEAASTVLKAAFAKMVADLMSAGKEVDLDGNRFMATNPDGIGDGIIMLKFNLLNRIGEKVSGLVSMSGQRNLDKSKYAELYNKVKRAIESSRQYFVDDKQKRRLEGYFNLLKKYEVNKLKTKPAFSNWGQYRFGNGVDIKSMIATYLKSGFIMKQSKEVWERNLNKFNKAKLNPHYLQTLTALENLRRAYLDLWAVIFGDSNGFKGSLSSEIGLKDLWGDFQERLKVVRENALPYAEGGVARDFNDSADGISKQLVEMIVTQVGRIKGEINNFNQANKEFLIRLLNEYKDKVGFLTKGILNNLLRMLETKTRKKTTSTIGQFRMTIKPTALINECTSLTVDFKKVIRAHQFISLIDRFKQFVDKINDLNSAAMKESVRTLVQEMDRFRDYFLGQGTINYAHHQAKVALFTGSINKLLGYYSSDDNLRISLEQFKSVLEKWQNDGSNTLYYDKSVRLFNEFKAAAFDKRKWDAVSAKLRAENGQRAHFLSYYQVSLNKMKEYHERYLRLVDVLNEMKSESEITKFQELLTGFKEDFSKFELKSDFKHVSGFYLQVTNLRNSLASRAFNNDGEIENMVNKVAGKIITVQDVNRRSIVRARAFMVGEVGRFVEWFKNNILLSFGNELQGKPAITSLFRKWNALISVAEKPLTWVVPVIDGRGIIKSQPKPDGVLEIKKPQEYSRALGNALKKLTYFQYCRRGDNIRIGVTKNMFLGAMKLIIKAYGLVLEGRVIETDKPRGVGNYDTTGIADMRLELQNLLK